MPIAAISELIDALRQQRLLEPAQLEELPRLQQPDVMALARELIGRGWLTPYQANMLLQGRGQELTLGSYVVLEKLGEGGMGIVYKARHRHMKRIVAIKLIRQQRLSNPDVVKRFQREVRAAAQLDHLNVVHAYDADQIGNSHVLIMEFVAGIDLAQLVKEKGPLPADQAADFIRQAALGLQHAYERGLIHRDIKPANLLVSGRAVSGDPPLYPPLSKGGIQGGYPKTTPHDSALTGSVVKILDMGLARIAPSGEESMTALTEEGMIAGTPDFIAPEQTLGSHSVDVRTDIYSLGCTFYFLLTGKPPFPGGTAGEKIAKHLAQEPVPIQELRPELPAGLAAVLRKMMAKQPGERFNTPGELAEALQKGLETGTWPEFGAVRSAPLAVPLLTSAAPAAIPLGRSVDTPTPPALVAPGSKSDHIAPAVVPASGGPASHAGSNQAASPMRLDRHQAAVLSAALGLVLWLAFATGLLFAPGTGRIIGVLLWVALVAAAAAGALLVRFRHFPPGPRSAPAAAGGPEHYDWQPAELVTVIGSHAWKHWGPVRGVAVSPDGRKVASCGDDGSVRLWDIDSGRELLSLRQRGVSCLALSPAGQRLATGSRDGTLCCWDIPTAAREALTGHTGPVLAVGFSADGQALASAGRERAGDHDLGCIRLWNAATGALRSVLQPAGTVQAIAFAPDGKTLAWASTDLTVKLSDPATGQELATLAGHSDLVTTLAFTPDGKYLVSGSGAKEACVRLWDCLTRKEVLSAQRGVAVGALAVAADSQSLAVAGGDGLIKIWQLPSGREQATLRGHVGPVHGVAFTPDGTLLISAGRDGTLRHWSTADGREKTALFKYGLGTYTPDGGTLVLLAGKIGKLIDPATGQERCRFQSPTAALVWVACAADGKVLATGSQDRGVKLWDLTSAQERATLPIDHARQPRLGVFAPDGRLLFSAAHDGKGTGELRLYDLEKHAELELLRQYTERVAAAGFSPDGRLLAWTGDDGTRLVDMPAGTEHWSGPQGGRTLGFSADGKTLAWACLDAGNGCVKLWDVDNARERAVLKAQRGPILSLAFAPDGNALVTSGADGLVIAWDPTTGTKLKDWQLPGPVLKVLFSPDGKQLALGNGNGTVYLLRPDLTLARQSRHEGGLQAGQPVAINNTSSF